MDEVAEKIRLKKESCKKPRSALDAKRGRASGESFPSLSPTKKRKISVVIIIDGNTTTTAATSLPRLPPTSKKTTEEEKKLVNSYEKLWTDDGNNSCQNGHPLM